ncbi:2-oxo-4-hydroxy-4-carboxy-5-ureidoimidazoline decarboxylase [Nocardioides sp. 31GB23]|uniref:2-oxo-4-hydroxy-4-carboxy-5-ureidoimidazoline decarboxylase n=1 Tax=Nocardioides sp. 31GB23 TaxID=3156065 RepID=UPI0032AEE0F8
MRLEELNTMSMAQAEAALRPCAAVTSWVRTLVDSRPYDDHDALVETARSAAASWGEAELDEALADHPRIGERPTGAGASAALSSREQSGVGDDSLVRARLAEGNRRYEERFGRIYLVRAAGRSAEEMLALLEQRLTHDPATERAVAIDQLAEIALLRLDALVEGPAS